MQDTIVCLIRHGQTEWNKQKLIQGTINNPLNEEGKKQSEKTAKLLKQIGFNWDILVSSPLDRAVETMNIISNNLNLNLEINIDKAFIEREFGKLEGASVCKESYDLMYSENVKGLEKLNDLKNRAVNALLNIGIKYPNKHVLITTHSQFIKAALLAVDDSFDFTYVIKNTSLNFFKISNNAVSLIKYNVTDDKEISL